MKSPMGFRLVSATTRKTISAFHKSIEHCSAPKPGSFFTKHADGVMRQRNELRLYLHYAPDPEKYTLGVPIEFNLRVRPFYDTAYDLTGWGQGQYRTYLAQDWQQNLNGSMDDQYDPLLREYYVDILPKNFFIRVGRQIISWGKSDGVYMLDILNPFNLSNPTNFDEQYNKIPTWALNANYQITPTGTFQFIYEPKYLPYYYPGLADQRRASLPGRLPRFHSQCSGLVQQRGKRTLRLQDSRRLPSAVEPRPATASMLPDGATRSPMFITP